MSCDPVALYAVLNEAENAIGRAMRAARKSDFARVWTETNVGIARAKEALAMCHDDVPHEHPTPTPTPTPAPTPTPPPVHDHTPPPAGDILAASVPAIPSNFDKSQWLAPTGLHTDNDGGGEGAFRMTANVSHLNFDDAIVHPGAPGKAHGHMYWGNTICHAGTTYESLRQNGGSTNEGGPLMRSSYWMPWVQIKRGGEWSIAIPDYVTMYYKRGDVARQAPAGMQSAPSIPRGLRMITRRPAMFALWRPDWAGEAKVGWRDLPHALAMLRPGWHIGIEIDFPNGWDGTRVDSADHMAHMAHQERDPQSGQVFLPASHPHLLPHITEKPMFTVKEGDDWTAMLLSSDFEMGAAPGETFHADYFEAGDDEIREEWTANAVNRLLNCSGGDLGSGRGLKRPPSFTFEQSPNRVPLASVPVGGEYRLIPA